LVSWFGTDLRDFFLGVGHGVKNGIKLGIITGIKSIWYKV
jgi:hypothetical protein